MCKINTEKYIFLLPAPPSSIEIQGYTHSSKVEVRENQDLTLTCIVANSKPAAEIKWYRGHVEYKPGKYLHCVSLFVHVYVCFIRIYIIIMNVC